MFQFCLRFDFFTRSHMIWFKISLIPLHHECIIQTIRIMSNVSWSFHKYGRFSSCSFFLAYVTIVIYICLIQWDQWVLKERLILKYSSFIHPSKRGQCFLPFSWLIELQTAIFKKRVMLEYILSRLIGCDRSTCIKLLKVSGHEPSVGFLNSGLGY